MKNDELKGQRQQNESTLTDEQIEQVSGGTVVAPRPDHLIVTGAVGDMKKDPA